MVLTTEGLNRMRDITKNDIYLAQAGTGTAVPLTSDTGLGSAIVLSANTPTLSVSDRQLTIVNVISSTEANGDSVAEHIVELGNSAANYLLMRSTTNPLTKSSTEEMIVLNRVFLRNNN